MITSFSKEFCYNLPGTQRFLFSPIENVCGIPERDGVYLVEDVSFKSGFQWLSGYSVKDVGLFTETDEDTPQGTRYNSSFSGTMPKNIPDILNIFRQMRERYHILKVIDRNGMIRLVGTKENPLKFKFSQTHGSGPDSLNSYTFEFFGSTWEPTPFMLLPEEAIGLDYSLDFGL